MKELYSVKPNTELSSGRKENLNPGPPDYKSSALTIRPRLFKTVDKCFLEMFVCACFFFSGLSK